MWVASFQRLNNNNCCDVTHKNGAGDGSINFYEFMVLMARRMKDDDNLEEIKAAFKGERKASCI